MESEIINDEVEWEACRVARAFGINDPSTARWNGLFASVQGSCALGEPLGVAAYWFDDQTTFVFTVQCELSLVIKQDAITEINGLVAHPDERVIPLEPIVRALYQLGYDCSLLENQARRPPLTAHEKLELRLSMPREFWPKKWLEEVGKREK